MTKQIGTEVIVADPEREEDYSPEMRALTDMQRRFVLAMLMTGGRDAKQCAIMAGYTNDNAAVQGYRLAHNDKILAAVGAEADRRLRFGAILGASVLVEIANDPTHKQRLKAATELLDRAGLIVRHEQKITVEHTDSRTDAEMVEQIRQRCKELGVDPRPFLGRAGIVDAEFETVQSDDPFAYTPET